MRTNTNPLEGGAADEPSGTINRRQFMKQAAATGAAAWCASQVLGAAQTGAGNVPQPGAVSGPGALADDPKVAVPLAPPDAQPPELPMPGIVPRKVGWAVVGLGELALGQGMPAFKQCRFSRPVALVSGHQDKARHVAQASGIEAIYSYADFDQILDNPQIEAVYIVLPNSMHAEYTIRALRAGKHVLCEKPMAPTEAECERMIGTARDVHRKLMIAYRLHFEPANLTVMELCKSKAYGEIKTFSSSNCQNVTAPNIRLSTKLAGGPVGDVGIYSINAARYCLNEEPFEVSAIAWQPADDPRFREVPESVTFTMRYPSGVLAMCECSFGTARSEFFRVLCANGYIEMDPAFSYQGQRVRIKAPGPQGAGPRLSELEIKEINQFTAEFDHFSQCILQDTAPSTPGEMGLADMRIVNAVHESIRTGLPVKLGARPGDIG